MFQNLTPVSKYIIIVNVVMFVLTYIVGMQFNMDLKLILSAYVPVSPNFHIYQVITHMFMHDGPMHILFNMMTLASFGPMIERDFGYRKFFIFYMVCGLGGFVLFNAWNMYQVHEISQTLTAHGVNVAEIFAKSSIAYQGNTGISYKTAEDLGLIKDLFSYLTSPMLGASGAIFGVVTAFAVLYPEAKLMIMFIPFPIKAKVLMPIVIVASIFLGFSNFGGIAHFAHLGGAVVGFFWARSFKKDHFQIN